VTAVQEWSTLLCRHDGRIFRINENKNSWINVGDLKLKRFAARMVAGLDGRLIHRRRDARDIARVG
jgi:hypothetical protein